MAVKAKPGAAKAAAPKGKTIGGLTAYCVKTKEKNVPIQDPEIIINKRGGYMAKGHDGNGNSMFAMITKDKGLAAVKAGAKKGF